MGFDAGFDMFSIMSMIFPIIFIIVFGFIIFSFAKGMKEWSNNNKQPRLNVDAKVVSKRTKVSGGAGDAPSSTWYFVTFQFESGDRTEFKVDGREYGHLAEGDTGELIFQGTRYHGFTRRQTGA
ncbi:DUF2500 domain-containing protein [Neobacillus sp. 114]|uniref:DUF2500 domain-containing protein n=1 Tax=Neobacillus sp. 114 TaxID=3048535 RepID=UPI001C22D64D|nr:DUF2500 domain-containing protein [Neobacillus sp. 114]MBU8918714.1 DUF2500 domain-containing protein [Bacillus sp. FJAT-29953]